MQHWKSGLFISLCFPLKSYSPGVSSTTGGAQGGSREGAGKNAGRGGDQPLTRNKSERRRFSRPRGSPPELRATRGPADWPLCPLAGFSGTPRWRRNASNERRRGSTVRSDPTGGVRSRRGPASPSRAPSAEAGRRGRVVDLDESPSSVCRRRRRVAAAASAP